MSDQHEGYVGPNDLVTCARPARKVLPASPVRPVAAYGLIMEEVPPLQPPAATQRHDDPEMFTRPVAPRRIDAVRACRAPSVLRDLSGRRALISLVIKFRPRGNCRGVAPDVHDLPVSQGPGSPLTETANAFPADWQSVKSSVCQRRNASALRP
jgi:hypothetical protein